jgi:enoyl-[acyl-carrier protein] reductase II
MSVAAQEVCHDIVNNIYPMRVTAKTTFELVLNQGGVNIREGDFFDVFQQGETVADVSSGEPLGAPEEKIATIRITRVDPKMSYAVVAEGTESGGHVGEMTTMALIPQVCDAVKIPVIAVGGIADGRGFAASLMLGACGVQIGTRFLAAEECSISEEYKTRVLKAKDTSTVVTGRRLGHPVRSLKSAFSRAYAKAEYTDISDEDLEAMAVGTLRAAVVDGDPKKGCFLAGQISGLVEKEQPAAEIIAEIMKQAESLLCE